MKYLDVTDVQKDLLKLLDEIGVSREEVMMTRDGMRIAKILPFKEAKPEESKYPLRGLPIQIAEDFDEPLPELWKVINK